MQLNLRLPWAKELEDTIQNYGLRQVGEQGGGTRWGRRCYGFYIAVETKTERNVSTRKKKESSERYLAHRQFKKKFEPESHLSVITIKKSEIL